MKSSGSRQRVVVTGMGVVSPLGLTLEEFWRGLVEGNSGIDKLTLCDHTGLSCTIAGEVNGFDPCNFMERKEARRTARFAQFAIAATRMAIEAARLDLSQEDPERLGVLLGNSGLGGLPETENECRVLFTKGAKRISPFYMIMNSPNTASAEVSILFGIKGYTSSVDTSCAAGTQAVGEATEVIRRGGADVMISGGAEAALTQLGIGGLAVMKALSTRNAEPARASRPFDAKRDGFVPAEGAGILILESLEHARRRNATILAEIIGYAACSDAYHMTAPCPQGSGAIRVMTWTLREGGVSPEEVDYISAHGTSTPLNDAVETSAIKRVFGEHAYHVPISSTKSMVGHLLGAGGAVEAIACVKTINEGIIHPTINYEYPDPACDLDYVPNTARKREVRTALSNSFGFGGQNACLLLKRFEE